MIKSKECRIEDSERSLREECERLRRGGDGLTIHYTGGVLAFSSRFAVFCSSVGLDRN